MGIQNQERDLGLIYEIRQGDEEAREELVRKYIPMVKHIVRNHYASSLEFEDLLQEGLIGLLSAIDEYRPEKQVKFSSFAYLCIIRKIYNVIKQTNGNKHKALNEAISLHAFINCEQNRTMLDFLVASDTFADPLGAIEEKLTRQVLDAVLADHLSVLEYTVISLLVRGYSCSEIESTIGVNSKAVDNARTRVKLKLRRILAEHGSLLSPKLPSKIRRREDLYMQIPPRLKAE